MITLAVWQGGRRMVDLLNFTPLLSLLCRRVYIWQSIRVRRPQVSSDSWPFASHADRVKDCDKQSAQAGL